MIQIAYCGCCLGKGGGKENEEKKIKYPPILLRLFKFTSAKISPLKKRGVTITHSAQNFYFCSTVRRYHI